MRFSNINIYIYMDADMIFIWMVSIVNMLGLSCWNVHICCRVPNFSYGEVRDFSYKQSRSTSIHTTTQWEHANNITRTYPQFQEMVCLIHSCRFCNWVSLASCLRVKEISNSLSSTIRKLANNQYVPPKGQITTMSW